MRALVALFGALCAMSSSAYLLIALWQVARYKRSVAAAVAPTRLAVTVLKPLCGTEPRLAECLRSFCAAARPGFQLVFGVREADDPAIGVVEALRAEFPATDIALVVDPRLHGNNLKVSNLINMMAVARHDIIVVSDSDARIDPDGLDRLLAPFARPDVGAVTCLYRSSAARNLPSTLAGMFIDSWFLSSAVVDIGFWPVDYCYGPLSAVRREALDSIGGFAALADHLADDFMLGKRVARRGWQLALSDYVIDTVVAESWRSLLSHELRWARTVKTVRPSQHVMSLVMWGLPAAGLAFFGPASIGAAAVGVPLALRLALHVLTRHRFRISARGPLWLVPVRELLCFAIWVASFASREVVWRDRRFRVSSSGLMAAPGSPP
jgi:ceramide glucosyltransferase